MKINIHKKPFNYLSISLFAVLTITIIGNFQKTSSKQLQTNILQAQEEPIIKTTKLNFENLQIPIFMYHHIDFNDPSRPNIMYIGTTTEKLTRELDLIQNLGYQTVTFADIENNNIQNKSIILTFDDGYDDFYTKGYPELVKRKMKAVIYVITNRLNTTGYLTTTQLKEMRNNGIEIASHTLNHLDLPTLNDEDLKNELTNSKAFLEKLLNQTVLSFAYPYGSYNSRVRTATEKAGYKYATTVKPGNAKFSKGLWDLSRHKVYSDTDINNFLIRE